MPEHTWVCTHVHRVGDVCTEPVSKPHTRTHTQTTNTSITLLSSAWLRLFMFTALQRVSHMLNCADNGVLFNTVFCFFLFVFCFGDANNNHLINFLLPYFNIYHGESGLTYNKLHNEEQPTSLLGHGCFHTSCRPCLASHASCPRSPCQTSSGTMPKHEMVVVRLIKRTGLWGQACSGPGPGPL